MRQTILAPSMLAADFSRLGEQFAALEKAGVRWLHIDVMDGAFVPNISFGMPVIASLRSCTKMFFDVHLMVQDPGRYIEATAEAGADLITVHTEACTHLDRVLEQIHSTGKQAGVALNPATSLSALDWVLPQTDLVLLMTVNPGYGGQKFIPYVTYKVQALRRRIDETGKPILIEVDGGVCPENLKMLREAGVDVFVAGSSLFQGNPAERAGLFLQILSEP